MGDINFEYVVPDEDGLRRLVLAQIAKLESSGGFHLTRRFEYEGRGYEMVLNPLEVEHEGQRQKLTVETERHYKLVL